MPIATFSIVAHDSQRQEWGVAVQSKFLAAAAVVSWARAGAGAVATQSFANLDYGPQGLKMMASGDSARETIETLVTDDPLRASRQVAMVDRQGQAFAYTGADCNDWAGHHVGQGYTCQGNILIPGTVEAMAEAFERVRQGPGEMADWLVQALAAGQKAGGDSRGRQAAGVLVVRENGGYGGKTDRYLDLRVDDDPFPIRRLVQLVAMHHLFFGSTNPADLLTIDEETALRIQQLVRRSDDYAGPLNGYLDDATVQAFTRLVGRENLEERWSGDRERIDRLVLDYLEDRLDD